MGSPDHEHLVLAAVHADRHPQHNLCFSDLDLAELAKAAPHRGGRAARPHRVLLVAPLVVEQEHHRVAAELDERAAAPIRLGEQRREAGVDQVDQLFGALLAPAREALGQASEPGDVGEHDRAADRLGQHVDRPRQAGEQRPRHERGKRSGFGLNLQADV